MPRELAREVYIQVCGDPAGGATPPGDRPEAMFSFKQQSVKEKKYSNYSAIYLIRGLPGAVVITFFPSGAKMPEIIAGNNIIAQC